MSAVEWAIFLFVLIPLIVWAGAMWISMISAFVTSLKEAVIVFFDKGNGGEQE